MSDENDISWDISAKDFDLILMIVIRVTKIVPVKERMNVLMDVQACHCNGCKLNLDELLKSDKRNFLHDIAGISKNINHETGKLDNHFWPRFAA